MLCSRTLDCAAARRRSSGRPGRRDPSPLRAVDAQVRTGAPAFALRPYFRSSPSRAQESTIARPGRFQHLDRQLELFGCARQLLRRPANLARRYWRPLELPPGELGLGRRCVGRNFGDDRLQRGGENVVGVGMRRCARIQADATGASVSVTIRRFNASRPLPVLGAIGALLSVNYAGKTTCNAPNPLANFVAGSYDSAILKA